MTPGASTAAVRSDLVGRGRSTIPHRIVAERNNIECAVHTIFSEKQGWIESHPLSAEE